VLRFSDSDGVGASNKENGTDGGSGTEPSLGLTTTQDNSAIVQIIGDWTANAGTRTYRSISGATHTEQSNYADGTSYASHGGYYDDVGTAGAKTVGMSAPVSMKYAIIAVEVKGTVSGPTITAQPTNVTKFTSETANFSVTATGSGTLTYQWKVSTDGSTYNNVSTGSGGTTDSYTTATLGYLDNADYYKCNVTDSGGNTDSDAALLTVLGAANGAWLRV
jgi:hypothetical protein